MANLKEQNWLFRWRFGAALLVGAGLLLSAGTAVAQSGVTERGLMVSKRTGVAIGSVWGLFIGVSKFDDASLNLRYAAKDAELLHGFFKKQFKGRVDEDHFTLLTNQKASRKAILKALKSVANRAFPDDLVFIFIATHGLPNDDNSDIFFFTPETDASVPSADGVSRSDLVNQLRRSKAGKIVIMLDACHAGSFSSSGLAFRGAETSEANKLLRGIGSAQDGVAVMMSSSAAERSQESDDFCGGHGAFSCALHDGLSGEANTNGNEYVELRELSDYVYKRVKKMSGGVQNPAIEGKFDNDLPLAIVEAQRAPEMGRKVTVEIGGGSAKDYKAPDVSDYEKLAADAARLESEKKRTDQAIKAYLESLEKAWKSVQKVAATTAVPKADRLKVVQKFLSEFQSDNPHTAEAQKLAAALQAHDEASSGDVLAPTYDAGIEWVWSDPAGLYFAKTETTVAQYEACVQAGSCKSGDHETKSDNKQCNWGHADRGDHPMNCIKWAGATSFCEWAGGRLPREDEWYAEASDSDQRDYAWGNKSPSCSLCVMNDGRTKGSARGKTDGCGEARTWPVCSKPSGNSVSGLCDMTGNVWEWLGGGRGMHMLRGGSWYHFNPVHMRASYRPRGIPDYSSNRNGFRCVRTSQP